MFLKRSKRLGAFLYFPSILKCLGSLRKPGSLQWLTVKVLCICAKCVVEISLNCLGSKFRKILLFFSSWLNLTCTISNVLLQHTLASVFFLSVLIKGLKQLHENQNPGQQLSENRSGGGLPNTNSTSGVQHVQIRVARLEENASNASSPMTALQIPVQITHVCK